MLITAAPVSLLAFVGQLNQMMMMLIATVLIGVLVYLPSHASPKAVKIFGQQREDGLDRMTHVTQPRLVAAATVVVSVARRLKLVQMTTKSPTALTATLRLGLLSLARLLPWGAVLLSPWQLASVSRVIPT